MSVDKPIHLFYSYAHTDAKLRDQLDNHLSLLRQHGFITQWYDRDISAGTDWSRQVDQHFNEARIILLLISSDYLASEYYSIEMGRALQRQEAGKARVIPILLRPVDLKDAPFAHLWALPQNKEPVTKWPNQDQAFKDIAEGIRGVVEELRRNGEPITSLPNQDQAFKDIVEGPHKVVAQLQIADQKAHSRNGEPVITWPNLNQAFEALAKGFRRVLRELQESDIIRKILLWVCTSIIKIIITIIIVIDKIAEALQRWVESQIDVDHKIPRWVYPSLVSMVIIMLVSGSAWGLISILPKSPDNPFPPLCSGNLRSANMSAQTDIMGEKLSTQTTSNGDLIGLSKGATIFDLQRPDLGEVQDKRQAAWDWVNNANLVVSLLKNARSSDPTDAEAQIYLENWTVLGLGRPYITFVVGVSFSSSFSGNSRVDYNGSSRSILQGAFTAQKECNDHNRQDASKPLIVLMIANTGQNIYRDNSANAHIVADEIADLKDTTIVGIMGWIYSTDSINVNHELRIKNSPLAMVSPSSSSDELGRMSNFFRIGHKNSEFAQIAADFLLNAKQKKRIAILYDQSTAYSNSLASDVVQDIQNNMARLESYRGDEPSSVQEALNSVLAQKPDAIFFAGYEGDLFTLLDDLSHTSYRNLLIVSAPALSDTNDLLKPLPDLHNVYFPTSSSPNMWNDQTPLFKEYKDNFGKLTAPTGLFRIDADVMGSYDAMLTLLDASQQVPSTKNTITASDLAPALRQITNETPIQGVTGRIAFDSNGDQHPNKVMFMEHIKGNGLVIDESQGCFLVTDTCNN